MPPRRLTATIVRGPRALALPLGHQRTANDGTAVGGVFSDPWGTVQGSSIAPFGFTGELQDQGLVNLRARWYDPRNGVFTGVDPFSGFPETPYSLHPYQYAYSAPTAWTGPRGEVVVAPICGIGYNPLYDETGSFVGCVEDPNAPEWLEFAKGWKPLPILPGPGAIGGTLGGTLGGATGVAGDVGRAVAGRSGDILRTCAAALAVAAGASQTSVNVDTQTREDDNPPKIYRSASGTPDSLTPRPGVDDVPGGGLSFFDSLSNPGVRPGKYVEVDTSKLQTLLVIPDDNPPGHVTVTPATSADLEAWAATRGTGQIHPYTAEIIAAISLISKK